VRWHVARGDVGHDRPAKFIRIGANPRLRLPFIHGSVRVKCGAAGAPPRASRQRLARRHAIAQDDTAEAAACDEAARVLVLLGSVGQ